MALSKNDINLEDAIDIREIRNIKLANQLLKLKRKKKQEREEAMQLQQQQTQMQQQFQSQKIAADAEMMKIQAEGQQKVQVKQAEVAFDIERMQMEAQLKNQLMQQEFNFNMQLKGLDEELIAGREDMREDAKGKRISQQNTEQSKLINQRKNNLPPINFESNEDSLDGFDLAEFDPR